MLHIMHLIESLEFGGAEKVVVHLANRFSEDNKISICLTKRKGELISELHEGIDVYCLHNHKGNNLSLAGQIKNLLVNNNVDVLHSHDWGVFLEAALAVRSSNDSKLIHTVHGPYMHYVPGYKSDIKIALRHAAERFVSRYVCKIISVSDSIKKYISEDIKIKNDLLQTIHNGISDISSDVDKLKMNNQINFVTTGRLAKIKNHELILHALREVLKNFNNIQLTIVGDGPERESLEKHCINLGIKQHVIFSGFITNVKDILLENDVFLLSSNYEGISIALLEAMSLSMPAIATHVGGVPETIIDNETGYLVPANDVQSYAQAMLKFITKPEKIKTLGKNARQHFLKKFHENVMIDQYRILYNQCLGK